MRIHIIGGGNLGMALALGITQFTSHQVQVSRRNVSKIEHFLNEKLHVSNDNAYRIDEADMVLLTIKPHQIAHVVSELAAQAPNALWVSAVSGWSLSQLQELTPSHYKWMRVMPNIAAQFGESATCISYSGAFLTEMHSVVELFNALGTAVVIDEKLMDAATVLGACGTAYALRYIRASMQAGIEIGFDAQTALAIASQTAKGAARMALEEKIHPEQLIDRVTTPQGCTIVGLNEMEHQGFSSALIQGIKTSLRKIKNP